MASSDPRLLGVLLCFNDGDIVEAAVRNLHEQGHDVIAWDHGSTDGTSDVLRGLKNELVELTEIPREFDFYNLYQEMSRHLQAEYIDRYDWISWPDQDEFLEGPDRARPYEDWIAEAFESPYNWIEFRNFNYWWTDNDDVDVSDPVARIRHYCLFPGCAPRIRSWRASATNIREFNHNPLSGEQHPHLFNLRHYPMRTHEQMERRLAVDRAGLRRGDANFHYENMRLWADRLTIDPDALHLDTGSDLNLEAVFDWRTIYGWADSAAEPIGEAKNASRSLRSLFRRRGTGTRPAE